MSMLKGIGGVLAVCVLSFFGAANANAQVAPAVFLSVDKDVMLADSSDVQTIRLFIPNPAPEQIDYAAIEINRAHGVNPARGRFRYTPARGFYEHGDNLLTGNAFVTLLPTSEVEIDAIGQSVTFIFRFTADPTYGDMRDNIISIAYSSSAQHFSSGMNAIYTDDFTVDSGGYIHSTFGDLRVQNPTVLADGMDVQEVVLVLKSENPDAITDARIRVNSSGSANAPQGYFAWRPSGFHERGESGTGSDQVELLIHGIDPSYREVATDPVLGPVVIYHFRWTISPSVGVTNDNAISYSWTEMQYRSNGSGAAAFDTGVVSVVAGEPGVQVTLDPSSPGAQLFAAGTNGVTLATFNFYATTTENVEIDSIYFSQAITSPDEASFQDYNLLYAVDEAGVVVGSMVPTSTKPYMDLASGSFIVDMNNTDGKKLYLKADLALIGPAQAVTVGGHYLGFNVASRFDVYGRGTVSGNNARVWFSTPAPSASIHRMYKGVPTFESLPLGTTTLTNGSNDLFQFRITANTGDVGLYKFTFDVAPTGVTPTLFELYDVTDDSVGDLLSANPFIIPGASSYVFDTRLNEDNPTAGFGGQERTVPAGQSRTFVLRATVTGASSGDSIATRMAGDHSEWSRAFITTLMTTAEEINRQLFSNDFIWSDRHATAHATTTADWTNGYLVGGLSSVSTSARVISL